jgi:membrane glycosyltransferase
MPRVSKYTFRRLLFGAITGATTIAMCAGLLSVLSTKGQSLLDVPIIISFLISITWITMNFWSSILGFIFLRIGHDPLNGIYPHDKQALDDDKLGRIAVVMTIRNENVPEVFLRLRAIERSLVATGTGQYFHFHVLSDSSKPDVIEQERAAVSLWRTESLIGQPIFYRRRSANVGYKPGNLREFCAENGGRYEFMVLLDADSLMSGDEIVRHINVLLRNPRIGILQSLVTGILPSSLFARIYEFGHRHGLHCVIVGNAWWQGDRCQFWGHNATIRLAPFVKFCRLPELPGKGPFSGHIICHDQIEASLMHRAGYQVRVVPTEAGSYELTPPTFFDFAKRNHRWFQGNLKNLKVLVAETLPRIDQFHLAIVAQRFLAWPALISTVTCAAILASNHREDFTSATSVLVKLYFAGMLMFVGPKFLGVVDALVTARAAYGGALRLLCGAAVESLFTCFLAPVAMFEASRFMLGLVFGYSVEWGEQNRYGGCVPIAAAARTLWPATAYGVSIYLLLVFRAPAAVPWFIPFLLGLIFSIPFTVVTAASSLNALAMQVGLCAIPEERFPPSEIRYVEGNSPQNGKGLNSDTLWVRSASRRPKTSIGGPEAL